MSIVLGIDPGKSGGLALVSSAKAETWPMPATLPDLFALLAGLHRERTGIDHAYIEKVGPTPQQGVKSVWTFAENYTALRAFCIALEIPLTQVLPLRALKAGGCHLSPPRYPKEAKARAKARAAHQKRQKHHTRSVMQELYPHVGCNGTRGLTLKVSDALLIAHVGWKEVGR